MVNEFFTGGHLGLHLIPALVWLTLVVSAVRIGRGLSEVVGRLRVLELKMAELVEKLER